LVGIACAGFALSASTVFGQVILYVDDDAPPDGDGSSWETPLRHLQDALAYARLHDEIDEIRVGQGSYRPDQGDGQFPGDPDSTFRLVYNVALRGGYAGFGAPDPDARDYELYETTLTGDLGDRAQPKGGDPTRANHVLSAIEGQGRDCLIEGFTITKGRAMPGSSRGGALLLSESNATIRQCRFVDNVAEDFGGAIGVSVSANLIIEHCLFTANQAGFPEADGAGGAIALGGGNVEITDCHFEGNTGASGGALYIPLHADAKVVARRSVFTGHTLSSNGGVFCCRSGSLSVEECTLEENTAGRGGVLYARYCQPRFIDCTVRGNQATEFGALDVDEEEPLFIANCRFIDNMADERTGAVTIGKGLIINSTFVGNTSGMNAGALWVRGRNPTMIFGCTFSGNVAADLGGAIWASTSLAPILIVNSVVSRNSAGLAGGGLSVGADFTTAEVDVANTIFWNNDVARSISEETQIVTWEPSTLEINYCCVLGWSGMFGTEGNIGEDPLFVDDDGPDDEVGTLDDDLRLGPGSPCIDAGDNNRLLACGLDLTGGVRRVDDPDTPDTGLGEPPIVDMGAHEFGTLPVDDCNGDMLVDECQVVEEPNSDCNANGVPDWCDIADGTSDDFDRNGVPDECDPPGYDCNGNGINDLWDVISGFSHDCNTNQVPDECEIEPGFEDDCNGNGIIDFCDARYGYAFDCNSNEVPDSCDITDGTSDDCNENGIPDECDIAEGQSPDCNGDGVIDSCEIDEGFADDCNENGIPDDCDVTSILEFQSGQLSPIGWESPQTFVIESPEPVVNDVTLTIKASAELLGDARFLRLHLNDVLLASLIFRSDGQNCPGLPNEQVWTISAATFNDALGSGDDAVFVISATEAVDPGECNPSWVSLDLAYPISSDADQNGNGIPDGCETCFGDLNVDFVVNVEDLLALLSAWGESDVPEDLNGDGIVNVLDLLALLGAWGECP
jgi:hypothetical protein